MDWYLQSNFPAILAILQDIKEAGNIFFRQVSICLSFPFSTFYPGFFLLYKLLHRIAIGLL